MNKKHSISLKKTIFKKYNVETLRLNISGFPLHQFLNEEYPISLKFKDVLGKQHNVEIDKELIINENGKKIKFDTIYELLYGMNQTEGIKAAIDYESSYSRIDRILLEPFKTNSVMVLNEVVPSDYTTSNIFVEELIELETIRYHCISPAGYSVALKEYDLNTIGNFWHTKGVFRIHNQVITKNKDQNLLVVADPLTADYFNSQQIPCISLPSKEELSYYDYPKLVKKGKVFFCLNSDGYDYNHSMYPFAEELISNGIEVFQVNLFNAFQQVPLSIWFGKHGLENFEEAIKNNSQRF